MVGMLFKTCHSSSQVPIYILPWHLRNRWINCLDMRPSMPFVSHIYHADMLANIDLYIQDRTWWDQMHVEISLDFARNKLGLTCFRLC